MNKIFCVFICVFILASCDSEKQPSSKNELEKEFAWFNSIENYQSDAKYLPKFEKKYTNLIQNQDFENVKLLLYNHGTVLHNLYQYDSTYVYRTINLIDNHKDLVKDSTYAILHYYLADLFLCNSNATEAIKWGEQALSFPEIKLEYDNLLNIKAALAYAYTLTNQPKLAIKQYLNMVSLAEKKQDYNVLGHAYNGIALIYVRLRLAKKARQMYEKSIVNFAKVSKNEPYFTTNTLYIQNVFDFGKDTAATLKLIDKLLLEYDAWEEPTDFAACYINGLKYLRSSIYNDLDSALYYNNLSMDYMKNNEANLHTFKIRDLQIYFKQNGKFKDEAEVVRYAEQERAAEDFESSAFLYGLLHEGEVAKGNLDAAVNFKKKEIELRELVQQQNADGQLFELEIKYETEKKEAELLKQKQIILRNNLIITILILVLGIVLTVYFIVNQVKKRKRAQVEMQRQQDFTTQLFLNTEEERKRIANELHDGVNHQLLTLKNNIITKKNIQANDINEVIEEVRNISRNLHPTVLQTVGFEAAVHNLCDKITDSGLFATCDIEYEQELDKIKELQLYRIIQEALNNTLKHGKANAAKVEITAQDDFLQLEIKDNGSGFDVEKQMNNPKSFGLQSILQRAKAIMANVNINSSPSGTVILLKIPIK